ncbi:MAG: hypothetical protein Kow00129_02820 [Thermoleophilia bacterium]
MQRRLSRRGLLLAAGGVALGALPAVPFLSRRASGTFLGLELRGRRGRALSPEELAEALTLAGNDLPVYLPAALPSGWTAAPYVTDEDLEERQEAVFLNPAVRPGRFYRVGYTNGSPSRPNQLITVTVRNRAAFDPPVPEPDPAPAYTARPPAGAGSRHSVNGNYLTISLPAGNGLDIVVQGLAIRRREVEAIAATVQAC